MFDPWANANAKSAGSGTPPNGPGGSAGGSAGPGGQRALTERDSHHGPLSSGGPVGPSAKLPNPGPFSTSSSFNADSDADSSRRRRRTAVIAGSVASVLLVSGAVTLAVANSGSPAPQPGHTGEPAALGVSSPSHDPVVILGPSANNASAATAGPSTTAPTPKATTASATPTASATSTGNFLLHAKVTASSSLSKTGFAAANLTNGVFTATSTDQGWSSKQDTAAATTEWVSIALSAETGVHEVNLHPRLYEGAVSCFPKSFTIAVSTDGTHWTTVVTKTGYTPTGPKTQTFNFTKVNAAYIKITATSLTQDAFKDYYLQFLQITAY